jgi:hypothetical protein
LRDGDASGIIVTGLESGDKSALSREPHLVAKSDSDSGRGGGSPRPEGFVSEDAERAADVRWRWTFNVLWTAA